MHPSVNGGAGGNALIGRTGGSRTNPDYLARGPVLPPAGEVRVATEIEDGEIQAFLAEWNRCALAGDAAGAARLRDPDYVLTLPNGSVLTVEQEAEWLRSPGTIPGALGTLESAISRDGDRALVVTMLKVENESGPSPVSAPFKCTMNLGKRDGEWRASSLVVERAGRWESAAPAAPRAGLPARAIGWLGRKVRRMLSGPPASFQELAYRPYRPGSDYALPLPARREAPPSELPIPPRPLWLGYHYPGEGEAQVRLMVELVEASGFAFEPGARILDFGCGAGRLIRHLAHLAGRCEIWGTDISAEHINWCRLNLSPPFRFATTTKMPHLPFEDRSFGLVYCGSVFTHIDDLADSWLLELHRILAPGGRLYVTIHDDHTLGLFEKAPYSEADYVRKIVATETFKAAKGRSAMFTVGRDEESQVFYDSSFFARMVEPMFDIISVTPEAYFYQTAWLLKRRGAGPG